MSPAITIRIVDWHQHQPALMAIRKAVFIDEQHVPMELEWDGRDKECTQFLALLDTQPVATARLTADGQIGRMAVLSEHRGHGIGAQLLAAVLEQARQTGFEQVFLHAQVSVIGFYNRQGFTAEGETFIEAGIEHQAMKLKLADPRNRPEPVD